MNHGQLASRGCAERPNLTLHGVLFDDLLTAHANARDAERSILEPVIFSKAVDYRRDVKQHKIGLEEKAQTDALLADYNARVTPAKRPTRKRKA